MESPSQWDPWSVAASQHPDVQVIVTETLPPRMQGCVDHKRRIIWLAADLTKIQARCTLAYEIAELQQGPIPADPCTAAAHRRAAEEWAAIMMIPTEALLDGFLTAGSIPEIAARLGVDPPTLRARLRGLTNDEQDALVGVSESRRLTA
jgi:hypothetical protein